MIHADAVRYAYAGRDPALDGVSFSLGRGALCGVVGANGSGKSTLLALLAGLFTPTSGALSVGGSLSSLREYQRSKLDISPNALIPSRYARAAAVDRASSNLARCARSSSRWHEISSSWDDAGRRGRRDDRRPGEPLPTIALPLQALRGAANRR
jgi:energy-coupling factor transporter ATP-binding protein EcfA2